MREAIAFKFMNSTLDLLARYSSKGIKSNNSSANANKQRDTEYLGGAKF